jgi:hypothetical protein
VIRPPSSPSDQGVESANLARVASPAGRAGQIPSPGPMRSRGRLPATRGRRPRGSWQGDSGRGPRPEEADHPNTLNCALATNTPRHRSRLEVGPGTERADFWWRTLPLRLDQPHLGYSALRQIATSESMGRQPRMPQGHGGITRSEGLSACAIHRRIGPRGDFDNRISPPVKLSASSSMPLPGGIESCRVSLTAPGCGPARLRPRVRR